MPDTPPATAPRLSPPADFAKFKQQHPAYVLLFRQGDAYELYHDDARIAHRTLGRTLSRLGGGHVPLATIPHDQLDGSLRRLIVAGHRVAICEKTTSDES